MDQETTSRAESGIEREAPPGESVSAKARRVIDSVPCGRRIAVIGGVVVLLILLVLGLQYLNSAQPERTGGRRGFGGPTPVGVAKVAQGTMPITLNALGTVTPLATVTVR